jgi:hypothetical protein
MSNALESLRAEFPKVDIRYARRHGIEREGRAYNDARANVDPANPRSIAKARRLKARLMAAADNTHNV